MNNNFSPEQIKQIEDAKLLISDDVTVEIISDDRLTPNQMEHLVVIACSHPKAAIDFYELPDGEIQKMTLEIRRDVKTGADAFLETNRRKAFSEKLNNLKREEPVDLNGDIRLKER